LSEELSPYSIGRLGRSLHFSILSISKTKNNRIMD
jgi:hypothetical protein